MHQLKVQVLDAVSPQVVPKSATSAERSATLPVTAQRQEATPRVDTKVVTVAVTADNSVAKLATAAVATDTCPVTALKAKSATTAEKLGISAVTARQRPPASELATSASNQVTSRLNAQTRQ